MEDVGGRRDVDRQQEEARIMHRILVLYAPCTSGTRDEHPALLHSPHYMAGPGNLAHDNDIHASCEWKPTARSREHAKAQRRTAIYMSSSRRSEIHKSDRTRVRVLDSRPKSQTGKRIHVCVCMYVCMYVPQPMLKSVEYNRMYTLSPCGRNQPCAS
jgi:hypothetical protein